MKLARKFSVFFITVALVLTLFSGLAFADDSTSGPAAASGTANSAGTVTWTYENGILSFEGEGAIDKYLQIGNRPWNSYSNYVSEIIIGEGITTIGLNDFRDFRYVKKVTLPEGLTSINGNAFLSCDWLSEINFPSTITNISACAFMNCPSLDNITLPEGLTVINKQTFQGCTSLSSITIPKNVTEIASKAFYECTSLTELTIPDNVQKIYTDTFYSCSSIKSVYIGSGLETIEPVNNATQMAGIRTSLCPFYSCGSIESVTVSPDNKTFDSRENCNCIVETASNKIVYGCKTSFIPEGITEIGTYAFEGASFTSVTFPSTLVTIDYCAFKDSALTSVVIPESVKHLYCGVFDGCSDLTKATFYTTDCTFDETTTDGQYADERVHLFENEAIVIYGYEGSTIQQYCETYSDLGYTFALLGDERIPLSACKAYIYDTKPIYTGEPLTVRTELYYNDQKLTEGTDYTVTFTNNVNAYIESVYVPTVTISGKGEYVGDIVDYFTIVKATPTITLNDTVCAYVEGKTFEIRTPVVTFNSAVTSPEAAGTPVITYYSDSNCKNKLSSAPTKAGTYYAKATLAESDNFYDAESNIAKLTVDYVSVITLDDKEAVYTGSPIEINPATVYGSTGKITYTYYTDEECSLVSETPVNVGTYYVKANVEGDSQYKGAESNVAKLVITKAPSSISLESKTAAYTGAPVSINDAIVSGSTGNISYLYYIDNNCNTRTTPSNSGAESVGGAPANLGTYYVIASVAADNNYERAESSIAKLVISDHPEKENIKSDSQITLKAKTATYTGKAIKVATAKVTGSTGAVTYIYYSNSACTKKVNSAVNAGTYYVKATVAADDNYNAATSAAVKLIIKKASNSFTKVTSSKAFKASVLKKSSKAFTIACTVKENAKKTFAVSSVTKKAKKYISLNKSTGKVTVKKGLAKGTYKLKVKITSKATTNYKATSATKTITIKVK